MDRLDQLLARSEREIEAHTDPDLAETPTGSYFIEEAAELLAGLRLWAQAQHHQTDQVVRELLEAADVVALNAAVRELQAIGSSDGRIAARMVAAAANRPTAELMAVAGYALRAL